jgi:hypothetical protein
MAKWVSTDYHKFDGLCPIARIILALTVQKYVGLQIGYGTNGKVLGLLWKSRFRCSKAAQSSTTKRMYDKGTSGLRTILRRTHWNIYERIREIREYEHVHSQTFKGNAYYMFVSTLLQHFKKIRIVLTQRTDMLLMMPTLSAYYLPKQMVFVLCEVGTEF